MAEEIKEKHPGGRPSKYTPALLEKANAYLDDYEHHGAVFPSHVGLSLYLEVTTETLYKWEKDESKLEFSDILRKIKAVQHEMLVGNGITGDFNPAITKLVLGKHGYSEKNQTDITSGGEKVKNEWHIHPVTTSKHGED